MSTDTPSPVNRKIGFVEFLVLAAALMACQALAIDAMLPALPTIAAAFNVDNENHAQWVVTAYVAGMGCGQLFWGVLSDRFGRRPVLLTGLSLYVLAALLAGYSNSFTGLLGWRYVHGLAAACVVVSRSVIRDLYSGRQMARVMSLTFIVFIMVPIMAPTIGQGILQLAPWRYLFVLFSVYGATVWTWVLLRLPETLHPEYRLTLTVTHVAQSASTMAMESMASVAGIAASFQGFVSTTGGALVGALIGRQFNNSTVPLATGAALCGLLALSFVMIAERGRLFRPHHSAG